MKNLKILLTSNITTVIKLGIMILVTMVVSSYVTSCFKQTEISEYIEEYEEFKEKADSAIIFSDSLNSILQENTVKLDSLSKNNIVLQNDLTRVIRQLEISERARREARSNVTDSIIEITPPEVLTYVNTLETENVDLKEALTVAKILTVSITEENLILYESLETQTFRADSLYNVVINIPEPPNNPNKIFFGLIPKPTRTQTFILGAAAGGLITWKLLNLNNSKKIF